MNKLSHRKATAAVKDFCRFPKISWFHRNISGGWEAAPHRWSFLCAQKERFGGRPSTEENTAVANVTRECQKELK
jgi:hypothetical protein